MGSEKCTWLDDSQLIYTDDGVECAKQEDGTYLDVRTSNPGLHEVVNELREEHVDHVIDILKVHNKELLKIDLSDLDKITDEDVIKMIKHECSINIWFYFRYVAKVPVNGCEFKPLTFNKFMVYKIMMFDKKDNKQIYVLGGRQMGNTLIQRFLFIYKTHFCIDYISDDDGIEYIVANYYIVSNNTMEKHEKKIIKDLLNNQKRYMTYDFDSMNNQQLMTFDKYMGLINHMIPKEYRDRTKIVRERIRLFISAQARSTHEIYRTEYEKLCVALESGLTIVRPTDKMELVEDVESFKTSLHTVSEEDIPVYLKINSIDGGIDKERHDRMVRLMSVANIDFASNMVSKEIYLQNVESMSDYTFHQLFGGIDRNYDTRAIIKNLVKDKEE